MKGRSCLVWVVVLVLFCLIADAQGVLPGFKATISQNGLTYAKDIGLKFLLQKLQQLTIPDQSGDASVPVIGTIDWQLTDIVLSGVSIPSSSITINPGQGLTVALTGVALSISMNFHYREQSWPHISGSGSINIDASQTSASVSVVVTDVNDRPHLSVTNDGVSIGNLNIQVHGGISWLYQFFIDVLAGKIKSDAENALSNAITNGVDQQANDALATINIIQKIGNDAEVDFGLVESPIFGSSYLTIGGKGEFYNPANPVEAPYTPTSTPDTVNSDMLQAFFSDYVPNTASYVFFKEGKMSGVITDKDLPSWSPLRLNTSSFSIFIPQLYAKYPNMAMQAQIYATQPPVATFSTKGLYAAGLGQIAVSVVGQQNQLIPVFTLGINATTLGKALIVEGDKIAGNLTYLTSGIYLVSSQVGSFDVSLLSDAVSLLISDAVVPFFNAYLSQGIDIPNIKGVTFNNPLIGYGNGYIYVTTDVTYTPPFKNRSIRKLIRILGTYG